MDIYLKRNSVVPEFYYSTEEVTETPVGYVKITEEERIILQDSIYANSDGSVVDGAWVINAPT
jgi:hypothetical protein